jgi:hypothetical protein
LADIEAVLQGHGFSRAATAPKKCRVPHICAVFADVGDPQAPPQRNAVFVFVSGHGFSRTVNAAKEMRASAPAPSPQINNRQAIESVLKGHGFSRAKIAPKKKWALAPEGRL